MNSLAPNFDEFRIDSISPLQEMGAYEWLWAQQGMTWKRMADMFRKDPEALPSDFAPTNESYSMANRVLRLLKERGVDSFGVRINHAGDYPSKLRDAKNPVELLYYQGTWELSEMPSLCIVGSRKASDEGKQRAARLARELVKRGYAVASGLAEGIDSAAQNAALEAGGKTIAVIGTPLGEFYPKKNRELQEHIAKEHLLVSQVPVVRYSQEHFKNKRNYFPERNATMSALTDGTIIVEAADTSGTLTQARAAMHQGRKLFILENCFQRTDITWPRHYEKMGAIRVKNPDDIWKALDADTISQN
jgi:DNA processing protein